MRRCTTSRMPIVSASRTASRAVRVRASRPTTPGAGPNRPASSQNWDRYPGGLLARRQTAEFPTFFVPELYVPLAKYGATDERPRVLSAAASWIPRPDAVGP